ncbi:hypothetical protein [Streptomyces sp. NPDC093094]|uniref:hypothetical protein n=1 Tax=Streptomyces sp. NPDC093094 TaxID=3366026 RepID=UPI003811D845
MSGGAAGDDALKQLGKLTGLLDAVHDLDPVLVEEIILTALPVRLFRKGGRAEADFLLETGVRALAGQLAKEEGQLGEVMADFYRRFRLVVRHPGKKAPFLLDELQAAGARWRELRPRLRSGRAEGVEEFITWFDREVDELTAVARRTRRQAQRSRGHSAQHQPAQARKPKATRAKADVPATTEEDGLRIYETFLDAASESSPEMFALMERISCFLPHNDPVWRRIAEKAASMKKAGSLRPKDIEDFAIHLQGVLGEALALRHPWVGHLMSEAGVRAQKLVTKLGKGWRVVVVESEVYATKTRGSGLGQLYDASLWIVRDGKREAAPLWIMEVKSGSLSTAPEQVRKSFFREIGGSARLPVAGGEAQQFAVSNLRSLLERNGVDPAASGLDDLSTQRLLVAPRPPTDRALSRGLPKGVAIDYVQSVMPQAEIRAVSTYLARAIKKAESAAAP